MRILGAIVEPTTDLLAIGVADLLHRRGIRAKPVGDDGPRSAIFLHDTLEKLQRRGLIPLRGDHRFQNLAFMIDGAPEIAELAVDLYKRLIQMPPPLKIAAHVRDPLLSDLGGKHRAKPVPPKPDRLMADVDPALGQEILDVAQRQRVFHVHHHDQTDYFWRAVEIPERVAHAPKLPQPETAQEIGLTEPFVVLGDRPVLLGTALLAYTFGLRHAVDADHIAAIDNVTRKLMQQGQRPVGVGFFFALGHSAVIVFLSVGVAFAASALTPRFDSMKAVGGVISTSASALFLFAIAVVNILVLISVYRTFQAVKRGEPFAEDDFDILLNKRGLLSRIFRPLFRLVTKSWHMLAIGFLFGLGFDTATEVALFGISSAQAANGMTFSSIMVFPALFTAGMTLVDTTDGVLMLGAYGWAFMKPIRKLYYNMTITAVSVIVALVIGGLETLNLIGDQLGLTDGGGFWRSE